MSSLVFSVSSVIFFFATLRLCGRLSSTTSLLGITTLGSRKDAKSQS